MDEKPRPHPEVTSRTTADRATKHDSQGETPSVKTEQGLSKVTHAISRNEKSSTARVKKTTTKLDQRDPVQKKIAKPFKFMEEEIETEGWQCEGLAKSYERMMIKKFITSDPVIQVLKPKLVDDIQGPVSIPVSRSNMLEGIYGIMQLLHEAGFEADMFGVRKVKECDQYQVTCA